MPYMWRRVPGVIPKPQGRNLRYLLAALALAAAIPLNPAQAADEEKAGPKVPRFVSLHADKVYLRRGPGPQYPIEWILTRRDMPVEIIQQYDHWRRIRQWDGTTGWVQERMVTGKRSVIVTGGVRTLHRQPDPSSAITAKAEAGVIAKLLECRGPWCRVDAGDASGWLKRTDIWGVYPDENVP